MGIDEEPAKQRQEQQTAGQHIIEPHDIICPQHNHRYHANQRPHWRILWGKDGAVAEWGQGITEPSQTCGVFSKNTPRAALTQPSNLDPGHCLSGRGRGGGGPGGSPHPRRRNAAYLQRTARMYRTGTLSIYIFLKTGNATHLFGPYIVPSPKHHQAPQKEMQRNARCH